MIKLNSLKENHLFSRSYTKGKCAATQTLAVYTFPVSYLRKSENVDFSKTYFGITVGKKLGCAVKRNRAKRLIREAYRQLLTRRGEPLRPAIIVAVARGRLISEKVKCRQVLSDMEKAFQTLGLLQKQAQKQNNNSTT